jgi:hypothetical protein
MRKASGGEGLSLSLGRRQQAGRRMPDMPGDRFGLMERFRVPSGFPRVRLFFPARSEKYYVTQLEYQCFE